MHHVLLTLFLVSDLLLGWRRKEQQRSRIDKATGAPSLRLVSHFAAYKVINKFALDFVDA